MHKKDINKYKPNYWFTSDTHYNHSNIVRGTSKWIESGIHIDSNHSGVRDFDLIEEHNDAIVNGINFNVNENDILYHLGDWSFGGLDSILEFRKRIICKNIHIILGNHDQHIFNNKHIFDRVNNKTIASKSLFISVNNYLEIKVPITKNDKYLHIILSHYSHRVWNKHHNGSYHLFGHSHSSLDYLQNGKSMDVGVDSAFKYFNEYRPFHIKEIIEILDSRQPQIIDSHVK